MKQGIRIAAFACGQIDRESSEGVLIVGIIYRKGIIEGILSGKVRADGTDSTTKIISMISASRFRDQVRAIALNGVALAGLNIADVTALKEEAMADVFIITKRKQDHGALINALKSHKRTTGNELAKKIKLVERQAELRQRTNSGLFVRSTAESYPKSMVNDAYAAIRLAHMIASGVSSGESKARI